MSDDKRQAIIEAAMGLIAERGFHGAPIALVAERAGVSAGTIYRYFSNKDELIEQIHLHKLQTMSDYLLSRFERKPDAWETFREIWISFFSYWCEHPQSLFFFYQYITSPYYRDKMEACYEYFAPITRFFEDLEAQGVAHCLQDEVLVVFVFDSATSLAMRVIAGQIDPDEALIEQATQAAWRVLAK